MISVEKRANPDRVVVTIPLEDTKELPALDESAFIQAVVKQLADSVEYLTNGTARRTMKASSN